MFLVLKIIKNWHFLTPLPPTSDYVIYEWSLSVLQIFFFRNKRFIIFFSFSGQSFSLDGLETGGMEQDIVNYDNIDIANLLGLQNAQSLDDIMPMAGTNSPFPN